jgi:ETC complex I subunit-like protein
MFARIYRPSKTAMQSGKAHTKSWLLEFDAETARRLDPLMGWAGAEDMTASEVHLSFNSQDEAIAYAKNHAIPFRVEPDHSPIAAPKAYSDNFAFRRRKPWTH